MLLSDIKIFHLLGKLSPSVQCIFFEDRKNIYEHHQNILQHINIENIDKLIEHMMEDIKEYLIKEISVCDIIALYEKQSFGNLASFLLEHLMEENSGNNLSILPLTKNKIIDSVQHQNNNINSDFFYTYSNHFC